MLSTIGASMNGRARVVIGRHAVSNVGYNMRATAVFETHCVTKAYSTSRSVASAPPEPELNFNDSETAFHSKTFLQLIRASLVYRICTMPVLVRNAESMMHTSYKYLGPRITNATMKYSFFGHFCAGENEPDMKPTVDYLHRNGIGAIFDYAAESDVAENDAVVEAPAAVARAAAAESAARSSSSGSGVFNHDESPYIDPAEMPPLTQYDSSQETIGRVYHYIDEAVCDKHAVIFANCIQSVHNSSPSGFAAMKITALGDPNLLKRMSSTLTEIRRLFRKFDSDGDGLITREQFDNSYNLYFHESNLTDDLFAKADKDSSGTIDYIEWSNTIVLESLTDLVKHCKDTSGPLSQSVLTSEEIKLVKSMRTRVDKLADMAAKLGVRLMIDAEHSYFQPAIDNIAYKLSKKYNKVGQPVIFNTYQMYLKDSSRRLQIDYDRSVRDGSTFAVKIVRGAYMVLEAAHAKETGGNDPVLPSLTETHDNYNGAISNLIRKMGEGKNVELMIASHNQGSIELALDEMKANGLDQSANVYFGQLLGMADHLTFTLGSDRYRAYKYVPYGKVNKVMPYLIRRAQENSDVLGNARHELAMITSEIKRRINPF